MWVSEERTLFCLFHFLDIENKSWLSAKAVCTVIKIKSFVFFRALLGIKG